VKAQYALRAPADRAKTVRKYGGNRSTEAAVEAALRWLSAHQNRDGSWSWGHTLGDRCSNYANPGDKQSKMGATGMALLPFLGAGYTHQEGKYKDAVRKGLKYLVGNMIVANNAGRLFEANGPRPEHMYCHALATMAVTEAYGITLDYSLKAAAQLAINYIVKAQNKQRGGWRYVPGRDSDTSVTGWQMLALQAAIDGQLHVPGSVKPLAKKWLDAVQSARPRGKPGIGSRYGYQGKYDRLANGPATTAIGLLCRRYLGTRTNDPGMQQGLRWVADRGWRPKDHYFNHFATMLLFTHGAPDDQLWKKWNTAMHDNLIAAQAKDGDERGSWFFANDLLGKSGGRVCCTAISALNLEVYYRIRPVSQDPAADAGAGVANE
jgi:hypothetical protein